jgi:hypothetical protein
MIVAFNDLDVSLDDLISIRRRVRGVMFDEPGWRLLAIDAGHSAETPPVHCVPSSSTFYDPRRRIPQAVSSVWPPPPLPPPTGAADRAGAASGSWQRKRWRVQRTAVAAVVVATAIICLELLL